MDHDEIVRRYGSRPGFEIAAYRGAALPVFKVRLKALFLDEKPLPPIQEHVLRCVEMGMVEEREISTVLGIPEATVRRSILRLLRSDDLEIGGGGADNRTQRLILTRKGQSTLAESKTTVPVESTITLLVDGLTRQISLDLELPLSRPRDLRREGLWELPAVPQRFPEIQEFSADGIRAAIGQYRRMKRLLGRSLIDVIAVEERTRLFRTDVVALIYKASSREATQIAFVIDGQISPSHEAAFAQAPRRHGDEQIITDLIVQGSKDLKTVGGVQIPSERVSELLLEESAAKADIKVLDDKLAKSPTEPAELRKQRDEAQRKLASLEVEMAQLRASLQDRPTATVADLIALGEGEHLEFKASARAPLRDGEPGQSMVIMVVKAVAGFYNGKGGTLLIGVQDGGTVSGLSADYLLFPRNQRNKDQYELWLRNTLGNFISKLVGPHLDVAFEIIQDRQICRVDVRPGPEPAYVQEGNVKDIFYVRQGNQTVKLSLSDAITYIRHRWPSLGPVAASGK